MQLVLASRMRCRQEPPLEVVQSPLEVTWTPLVAAQPPLELALVEWGGGSRGGGDGRDWRHGWGCHGWIGDPFCEDVAEL